VLLNDHCHAIHRWLEKEDFVKYYKIARCRALNSNNIMSAWRKTGLIPLNSQEVLLKLPNRPITPPNDVVNENPLNLLVGVGQSYVEKATEAIKQTMPESPAKRVISTIEYLNANNAILSKINTDLVATTRTHKESKKGKRVINKARFLSKADADKLREEQEAKHMADIAHKRAMGEKKHQQALKKAQIEAEKLERAEQRAVAKDTREINREMARMARIYSHLFT
jgi:hypothetical protein